MGRSRGGLTSKIHAIVDTNGLPVRLGLTAGEAHDNRLALSLLSRLRSGSMLLADRGYDADWIRAFATERGAWANVPPRCNRRELICFSPHLYRARNLERAIEADVLPYAVGAGLAILSYGALCRGLLSGCMTLGTQFDGDDLRKIDPKFQGKRFRQYLTAVDELKRIAHERFGKSVLALAVRWVLDQGPTIALWGARNPSQLDPIGDVEGWHIDPATKAEIDAILKRCIVNPVSPAFMAPPVTRPKDELLAA
jgi:transposase